MTNHYNAQLRLRAASSVLLAQSEELFCTAEKAVNVAVEASCGNAARTVKLLEDAAAFHSAAGAVLEGQPAAKPFLDLLCGPAKA